MKVETYERPVYIFEHRCPPQLCEGVGHQVHFYPKVEGGTVEVGRLVCQDGGTELFLVEQKQVAVVIR